ncbi:MAG TPA: maleylpyruvate isomerase N-terminal domain-containing protein [Jatrophihabitantaceae bacterium]|nr:maleylpyruvate isomerase N-terminal domain-containing protein [Jatrophihabitantaceae bacterium]
MTHEAEAFFDALDSVPPGAVTACRGWTAHELIAHLASGADAFANQIEAHLAGDPVPEFGAWQDREPPYRALSDTVLRRRLVAAGQRMDAAFGAMLADDPAVAVPEIGWGLPVAELVTHMRQEFAIHRWDLLGDDEAGLDLLGQPVLIEHSVALLAGSLLSGLGADPNPAEVLTARLRCPGSRDLVVRIGDGTGSLSWADPTDAPGVIETDPAARILLLWGRRPASAARVRSTLAPDGLARLQTVLAGY